jgi:triosephosphate isomerase
MPRLRLPILIINFKTYPEVSGLKAVKLARYAESVAKEMSVSIAVSPPTPNLASVAAEVNLPVLAQHVDPVKPGGTTGYAPVELIKDAGAVGSLINHSEHRIPRKLVAATVEKLNELGMTSVVCAGTLREVVPLAKLKPTFLAVEPPELIGSGIAVSRARPELISDSVKAVSKAAPSVEVICGAGVVDGNDVASALKLGARGVLVASGIVKADDVPAKIREMADPLRKISS